MTGTVEIRPARADEAAAVAIAVTQLIRELRDDPASLVHGADRAAADLIAMSDLGGVVVAAEDGIVGLVGYSFPSAIRVGGRYCLIQELWVAPPRRRDGLGRRLLEEVRHQC